MNATLIHAACSMEFDPRRGFTILRIQEWTHKIPNRQRIGVGDSRRKDLYQFILTDLSANVYSNMQLAFRELDGPEGPTHPAKDMDSQASTRWRSKPRTYGDRGSFHGVRRQIREAVLLSLSRRRDELYLGGAGRGSRHEVRGMQRSSERDRDLLDIYHPRVHSSNRRGGLRSAMPPPP
nr:hypothetical protein Iba_chr03bCG12380 [Ipomoea batatas]